MPKNPGNRLSLVLLMGASACGGTIETAELEPTLWPSRLHELSAAPGCFREPPVVEIPEGVSDKVIEQQQGFAVARDQQARSCLERFGLILDTMGASPGAEEWTVDHYAGDGHVKSRVTTKGRRDGSEGEFAVDMLRTPSARWPSLREAEDACFQTSAEHIKVAGSYNDERTVIDQGQYILFWNKQAIVLARRSPIGPIGILYRGCDPELDISYGLLISYHTHTGPRCWTSDGKFVSCDEVNTWPFTD